jgi:hypothetical protein
LERKPMSPFGSVEFNIEELPAELRIRYIRHAGWIERILAPAAVPALGAIGWFGQRPELIMGAGALVMLLIFRWAWSHQSVLRVLPDRLISSVYLWNETEIALSDIESIKWLRRDFIDQRSNKYEGPRGLYVWRAGCSKCVLPLVSEEQARAATDAIFRKFPKYPINVSVGGSSGFDAPLTAFARPSSAELDSNNKNN